MSETNENKNTAEVPVNNAKTPSRLNQWHAGFCSAMQLELRDQWPVLDFYREYSLTRKALAIDLLVIRKVKDIPIRNKIGKFFRKHNILEYKSPDDEMGIDAYYKTLAYACLYKVDAPFENGILAEDITISLVRENYPRTLFKFFMEKGYKVREVSPGIYYVRKAGAFDTQVLVTGKLSKKDNLWLTSLTRHLSEDEAKKLLAKIKKLKGTLPEALGSSVLNVALRANPESFLEISKEGDTNMISCPALDEFYAPRLKESNMKVYLEAMKEVTDFETAKKKFQAKFQLDSKQAEEKMKIYW